MTPNVALPILDVFTELRVRTFLTRDRPTRLRTALPLYRAYRSPIQRVNQSPFRVTCGCAAVSRSRRMNKSKFAQTIGPLPK